MKNNDNPNQPTTLSQTRAILSYLKSGHRLTQLQAIDMFGCMRLPSRIHDIEKLGIVVNRQFIKLLSGKRVKEYWI